MVSLLSRYSAILGYEKRGTSARFSYYGLPAGCDTVFFPGCTLPGTRPETTWKLFGHLQQHTPGLGVVLDCCTKPSHDLGRKAHADEMFGEMRQYLISRGVTTVLVACPNCYKMFRQYGAGLQVRTVYEVIDRQGLPDESRAAGELTIHDPCPLRQEPAVQDAVRRLLSRMGVTVAEMKHRRKRTLCCGEGGSVGFVQPDLARHWRQLRREEAAGRKIVTYCAGCAGLLRGIGPVVHIADLIFNPAPSMNGGPKVSKAPVTYLNRLRLKRRFKTALAPAVERVRPAGGPKRPPSGEPLFTAADGLNTLRNKIVAVAAALLAGVAIYFTYI